MTSLRPAASHDPLTVINDHFLASAREMLDVYRTPFDHVSPGEAASNPLTGEVVLANIGYTGRAIRGSVVMFVTAEAARQLAEETTGNTSPEGLCDTVAELSNMLLGRLKNRLLQHGVVLALATPTAAIGQGVRVFASATGAARWHRFVGEGGAVDVRNDAVIDPEFVMDYEPAAPLSGGVAEGGMLLF